MKPWMFSESVQRLPRDRRVAYIVDIELCFSLFMDIFAKHSASLAKQKHATDKIFDVL